MMNHFEEEDPLYMVRINRENNGNLTVTHRNGTRYPISNRYGWSSHNCKCPGRKTGLVLYPFDTDYKNIVLLVCENCYDYQRNGGTQHDQLLRWYYRIYGDSKRFRCVSGFSQKVDGSLGFNSYSQNTTGYYTDNINTMSQLEQEIVRKVVHEQLHSYEA
ncbi:hypothetical protein I4U23_004140 [Adineta vaga]|nr:hypothetical protein I4U23_004140 [Adineta vaga]